MRKTLLIAATALACCLPTISSAATDPCRSFSTATRKANSLADKRDRTVTKLQDRLNRKAESYAAKRQRLDERIGSYRASAEAQNVKLSACNPAAGFVNIIWEEADASASVCTASNSFIGHAFGSLESGVDCALTCATGGLIGGIFGGGDSDYQACFSQCQARNGKQAEQCRKKASSVCSSIVKYRVKAESLESQKASFSSTCTGATMQLCPNGVLRSLYIQLNGDGTTVGAIPAAAESRAAVGTATAAEQCCTSSGGTKHIEGGQCI